MKCKKCGKRLRSNEKFCTVCGYYNDEKIEDNFNPDDVDLLNENWYEDDLELDDSDDDDIDLEEEPVNKEKPKKEKTKKEKKEKQKKETKEEVKEEKPKKEKPKYKNEKYLEAFIGEDYNTIKNNPFNIYAFLLNWIYFLYRKLYITGIIGLIITSLVAYFLTKFFLIYVIVCIIVLGFAFNPYYLFIGKKRTEKTLERFEGSDTESLKDECRKAGGVNVLYALIIYFVFIIIIIIGLVRSNVSLNSNHNTKFFKENSENKATCMSLIKIAYKEEANNYDKIVDAVCKKQSNNNEYELYLKEQKNGKLIYVFYETSKGYIIYNKDTGKLDSLNSKKTLTDYEVKLKNELNQIVTNYKVAVKKAEEEDKLIEDKKNTSEKYNYVFTYKEIIR